MGRAALLFDLDGTVRRKNPIRIAGFAAAIGKRDRFGARIVAAGGAQGIPRPAPRLSTLAALTELPDASIAVAGGPPGRRPARDAGAKGTLSDFTDPALGPLLARSTGVSA